MANFQPAVAKVLLHEGKLSLDKRDPGGATNYGISLRWLAQEGKLDLDKDGFMDGDLDHDGDIDVDDILVMKVDDAVVMYKRHWWDKYGYEGIDSQAVADKVMSFSVNMGAKQAHMLWQRALNALGASLSVDGIAGKQTLAQTNKVSPKELETALSNEAAKFYRELVAKKPQLGVYLNGWLKRAYA